MNDATTLELGLAPDNAPLAGRRVPIRTIAAAAVVVAAAVGALQFVAGPGFSGIRGAFGWDEAPKAPPATAVRVTAREKQAVANLTVDDQAQIVVAGKVAEERNAAIPLSGLPLEQVRGFLVAAVKPAAATTALTCLTQAIYYEAANEPITGRRAVAQVVLNRMRHPAYPKSVCGVVYQGSERRTGCQFSFTCDGSLLRKPGAAWRESHEVARAALAGYVEPTVGTATHYHANYVLPKWAFNLAKIQQIGAHIFYRFRGGWGNSRAFNGAYSGAEYIPSLNVTALRQRQEEAAAAGLTGMPREVLTDGLTVSPHITDRHDPRDVGGRINVTKLWRMTIQTPTESSSGYRAMLDAQGVVDEEVKPLPVSNSAASALPEE